MEKEPKVTVNISPGVSDEQLESLRSVLHHEAFVQEETHRVITGVEWAAIIVALKVTGAGAGAAAGILALAREINKWRRELSQDNEPAVFFQRPNQPQLNLATATDKEVRNWLATAAADEEVPEWMATATDEDLRIWISRRLNQE
jgi:hypothetical protein